MKPGRVIPSPGKGLPGPGPARRAERVLPQLGHTMVRPKRRSGQREPGGVIGPSSTSVDFTGLTGRPVAKVRTVDVCA